MALIESGQLLQGGIPATGVLETLLERRSRGDVAEAEAAVERVAAAPADEGLAVCDFWLLRLRAPHPGARAQAVGPPEHPTPESPPAAAIQFK